MGADQNHASSHYSYDFALATGSGERANPEEGARYIKIAADQGGAEVLSVYGFLLLKSNGVPIGSGGISVVLEDSG